MILEKLIVPLIEQNKLLGWVTLFPRIPFVVLNIPDTRPFAVMKKGRIIVGCNLIFWERDDYM